MRPPPPSSDERPLVLLAQPLFPDFAAALAGRFRFALAADADAADTAEGKVLHVGLKPVTDEHLTAFPALELVAGISVGVDHVDLAACRRRGLSLTNAGAAFAVDSADYAVGLLIAVLRQVAAAEALRGKRVGIIGLGSIGSGIARRLQAFGCVVSYHSRRQKHDISYTYHPTILDLAASSDVLVVACALTAETRHVVDRAVLDALGSGGVLVNVARGANVDEAELVRALAEGRIAGAGLEVFEDEPNVPAELLGMDNVVLTHHQAAYTLEAMADLDRLVVGNLEAFFAGAPLLTPVLQVLD
ncbi:glyoxylate/hydroxypyruvate reductase HPR3-like [Lolium rigidum]|uniref:glyoxylate/hydroxypyruvate reductase HPR3-like n=1 Tax=Lolium rigidum TaxID=89674 RepID=UPI001F5CE83D|nr:glyoxylate/hydroxypyruvate reductase HPR3-like [Lolium rigidum]